MNKRILFSALAFFLGALYLPAADFNAVKVPSVTVTVSDFTLDYSPASRAVSLTPHSGGTTRSGTSDANGVVGFVRVTPGLYTLTIAGIALDPLTLQVPNQTGTLSASNLVISAWTPPAAATAAKPTDNLRAWSLLGTNPLNLPGGISLSGETDLLLTIADGELLLDGDAIGGGDTIWTNESGVIHPIATNAFYVHPIGSLFIGANTLGIAGAPTLGETLVAYWDVAAGDADGLAMHIEARDGSAKGYFDLFGSSAGGCYLEVAAGAANLGRVNLDAYADGTADIAIKIGPTFRTILTPGVADGATAVAYTLDTTNALATPGAKLLSIRNSASEKASIDKDGKISVAAGISSTDTTAAVAIAATGWTNTFGKNAVVYYDGTAVTAIVKNNAGTSIYTNAVALTGNSSILLQPSGAVILSGTGVTGRATPF